MKCARALPIAEDATCEPTADVRGAGEVENAPARDAQTPVNSHWALPPGMPLVARGAPGWRGATCTRVSPRRQMQCFTGLYARALLL